MEVIGVIKAPPGRPDAPPDPADEETGHLIHALDVDSPPLPSSSLGGTRVRRLLLLLTSCGLFVIAAFALAAWWSSSTSPSPPSSATSAAPATSATATGNSEGPPCVAGSVRGTGATSSHMCFSFFNEPKDFEDAERACVQWQGHLATVNDDFDNTLVLGLCDAKRCWLGLNDRESEGAFRWAYPVQSPTWTNWKPGTPDNYEDEDCVYMYGGRYSKADARGLWNDKTCFAPSHFPFICARPASAQNPPPSAAPSASQCTGYSSQANCDPGPVDLEPPVECGGGDEAGLVVSRFGIVGDIGWDDGHCEAHVAALVDSFEASYGPLDYMLVTGDLNYWEGSCTTVHKNSGKHYGRYFPGIKTCGDHVYNVSGQSSSGSGATPPLNRFYPCLGNHDWYDNLPMAQLPELPYFQVRGDGREGFIYSCQCRY